MTLSSGRWTNYGTYQKQTRTGPAIGTRAWFMEQVDRNSALCVSAIAFGRDDTARAYAEFVFRNLRQAQHPVTEEPKS